MKNPPLRAFVTGMLVALLALAPNLAAAQSASRPAQSAPRGAGNASDESARDRALIRRAVQNVHDSYRRSRQADGVGGIVGGLLVGGIGGYLYIAGDDAGDPGLQVVGVGIALSAIPQLIAGFWNIFYETPQEEIADKLLADKQLLDGAGLTFVEQEARRARRSRLVGGTTSIAGGAALFGSYYLYSRVFGSADILLIFFSVAAGLQTISGIVTLVGLSGPEKAYRDLMQDLGRSDEPDPDSNRISRARVVPTVLSDDGNVAPGFGLSLSF